MFDLKILFVLSQGDLHLEQTEANLREVSPVGLSWSITSTDEATHLFELVKRDVSQEKYDWVAVIEQPVQFSKNEFSSLLRFLNESGDQDIVYSDSTARAGRQKLERPDFSPERLRSQNYFGPLVFFKPGIILDAANQGETLGELAAFALILNASRQTSLVGHFRSSGYVELGAVSTLTDVAREELAVLVEKHLKATGGGSVHSVERNGLIRSSRIIEGEPLVSIVIPTMGVMGQQGNAQQSFILDAVQSIMDKTSYRNFELVIVVDSIAEPQVLEKLAELAGPQLRLVTWTKPFNFSEKMNFGVLHARGEFVLLLNDDVKVINSLWLSSMLGLARRPNAGMVGAMLYYEDETIQHAGHAYYQGSPTHIGLGLPRGSQGPNSGFLVEREVSGVTAACALMPIDVFKQVGGFTALLPGNFNDVDLCMKVGWRGFDIYWTPYAELYHFESKTRDAHVHYYELDVIEHRWGLRLDDSRYWRGHPWADQ